MTAARIRNIRLKLSWFQMTDVQRQEAIAEGRRRAMTYSEIAAACGTEASDVVNFDLAGKLPPAQPKRFPKPVEKPSAAVDATWTKERIERLLAMHEDGMSASEIAMSFGGAFSRNAICGKLNREKRKRGIIPATRKPRTRAQRADDLNIAARMKRHAREGRQPPTLRIIGTVPTPPSEPIKAPDGPGVSFWDRRPDQCVYPIWETQDDHRNCCGAPVKAESRLQYCPVHYEICTRRVSAKEANREADATAGRIMRGMHKMRGAA